MNIDSLTFWVSADLDTILIEVSRIHRCLVRLSYKGICRGHFPARKLECGRVLRRLCGHIPSYHATRIYASPLHTKKSGNCSKKRIVDVTNL